MLMDRIFTPGLAQVAYLVADESAGEVAVIDPRRDVDVYISWADRHRARIAAVLETHIHADFISGAHELALRTGAPVFTSRFGDQAFPHHQLDDGEEVAVGALRLRAFWTPGHTPEHLSYLLFEQAGDADPVAMFSGDFIFVGDVGRPDLLGEEQTRELSEHLHESTSRRMTGFRDSLVIYPGHTGGSSCGKKIGDAPRTTLGMERLGNYAFQAKERDAFVRQVLADMPAPPTYYPVLKRVNAQGATPLAELPEPRPMSPDDIQAAMREGALVVDARDSVAFGKGHIPGALFAGFGPNFHAWMGWVAPYDRDLVIVPADETEAGEIVTALRQIGLDRVRGYLDGGMASWTAAGKATEPLPQIAASDLAARMEAGDNLTVLDVRSPEEFAEGHIAGACHVFAGEIAQGAGLPDDLDRAAPIAVICGSGYRSSVVSSVLMQRGREHLINVAGGMSGWDAERLPTT